MKAYRRHEEKFMFPDDMKRIIDYLSQNGDVFVADKVIEKMYKQFSAEVYCAGWMELTDEMLKEFEIWLNDREICI